MCFVITRLRSIEASSKSVCTIPRYSIRCRNAVLAGMAFAKAALGLAIIGMKESLGSDKVRPRPRLRNAKADGSLPESSTALPASMVASRLNCETRPVPWMTALK
jgi:hypothetical protein